MPSFSATRQIAASPSVVWRYLADVLAWPDWLPTVSRVEPLSSPELSIGSRYRVVQPRLRPTIWQVTTVEPGRNFAWEASSPGLAMRADHTVRSSRDGGSEVGLEFRFSGLLAPLVALLAGGITRRYLTIEADTLKERAETETRARLR